MMESLPQSSEEMIEEHRVCDPCKGEGETKFAKTFCLDCKEVVCKFCLKCHKNLKLTKDHTLIDVNELPAETGRADFFIGVGKCVDHPERDVEFYCISHDEVICALCLTTCQHKPCEITEIGRRIIDATKLQKESEILVTRMKTAIEHLKLLQMLRIKSKNNLKQKLKEIREQVRDQMVQLMDSVVSHVSDVTKQIEIEKEDEIDAEMARVAKIKVLIEQQVALLNTIGKHGSARHKFVSAYLVKNQYEDTVKLISEEDDRVTHLDAKVIIDDNLEKLIESTDVDKPVQIKVTESHTPIAPMSIPPREEVNIPNVLRDSKLVKFEEHIVCTKTGRTPAYRGVSIYRDGRIILSDYSRNGYLYIYKPVNNTVLELALDGPISAVQIDDTYLAFSTGEDKTINIVNVGDKLRVEKTFQTRNCPFALVALNNGQVAVAWNRPPAFSVIDIGETNIVQKLYLDQDTNGRKFKSFANLAVDEMRQHVIQPCTADQAVYCFDYTGKPVFVYTHPGLTHPAGVALDKCGNIYVCENSAAGSLHSVSPTGDPIRVVMEGVPSFPYAICSDVMETGFWVTRFASNLSSRDKVVYFKLEQNTSA